MVSMPKLSIHEDGLPALADNDIGPAGQVFGVNAVADTLCPECFPQ